MVGPQAPPTAAAVSAMTRAASAAGPSYGLPLSSAKTPNQKGPFCTPIRGPVCVLIDTADTARGEKRLSSGQNQAILLSSGRPLGECQFSRLGSIGLDPSHF